MIWLFAGKISSIISAMKNDVVLEVEKLSVSFNENKVLENISFSLKMGEVLAIVGPNGAGKSVLFRALLGLIPHTGSISWTADIKIGYVPQKLGLEREMPLTVREFLSLKSSKNGQDILPVLESVGINIGPKNEHHLEHHILNRRLGFLSGGELQRILIAWALLGNPDVLLFDEPTAGIDIGGEGTIYNLLHKLQTSSKLTILLISHDLNIVYKYADTVICLNKSLVCFGEPHEVLDPKGLSDLYGGESKFYQHIHDH